MFETPIRFGTIHRARSFFLNQPIASEDETPAFYDEKYQLAVTCCHFLGRWMTLSSNSLPSFLPEYLPSVLLTSFLIEVFLLRPRILSCHPFCVCLVCFTSVVCLCHFSSFFWAAYGLRIMHNYPALLSAPKILSCHPFCVWCVLRLSSVSVNFSSFFWAAYGLRMYA